MSSTFLSQLPLSRQEIDRDHETRSRAGLFDELWADPTTRLLPLWRGRALAAETFSERPALAFVPTSAVHSHELWVYLGISLSRTSPEPVGTRLVLVVVDDDEAERLEPDEARWLNLREVATTLSDRDAGAFVQSLAIAGWHASHSHSPRSGAETVPEKGGWVRRDPELGVELFPRTDAAVIVGIVDENDRMLLGSNAMWKQNRYSLLAGFVEPGESFESAAQREVFEESGVRILPPEYLGSQPWPFPASLMVGFIARVDPAFAHEALKPDGEEILDLRWFSRQEIADPKNGIALPGPSSIAHAIIERWYGGPLPEEALAW
ncbi:NAD(+) diphosphatase [Agreia sp. COWG]|uniref:NAD(+) diphosphatase n=1 Tax=Agreia sp. COWG TaxID=2773266 RepID=UPI0019259C1B|nr:NAD(+) diphosphatase [Agreia sp. COWG]CAD6001583.1 NAD+ diphosphatase [Agreia sp. COWG]